MNHSHQHISGKSRFSLPRLLAARNTYTPEEVRLGLRVDVPRDRRTAAIHAAAAQTAIWSGRLPKEVAVDMGRAAARLPTVVFWYRQGLPAHEIGRRLSPFGSAWDGNRAIEVAAALIADSLNRGLLQDLAA